MSENIIGLNNLHVHACTANWMVDSKSYSLAKSVAILCLDISLTCSLEIHVNGTVVFGTRVNLLYLSSLDLGQMKVRELGPELILSIGWLPIEDLTSTSMLVVDFHRLRIL